MALPNMPENYISREYLRVGGGYGAPAKGTSPAGGLDIDAAGNLATDGDITARGLALSGANTAWNVTIPMSHGTGFGAAQQSIDLGAQRPKFPYWEYPADVWSEVCFPFVLPHDYAAAPLKATWFWTADGGVVDELVSWRLYCKGFSDGEDLDGPAGDTLMPLLDTRSDAFQGPRCVHVVAADFIPTNGGPCQACFLTLRRNAAPASTLAASTWLIGLHISYA